MGTLKEAKLRIVTTAHQMHAAILARRLLTGQQLVWDYDFYDTEMGPLEAFRNHENSCNCKVRSCMFAYVLDIRLDILLLLIFSQILSNDDFFLINYCIHSWVSYQLQAHSTIVPPSSLCPPGRWSGAGVGVGMLRGAGASLTWK